MYSKIKDCNFQDENMNCTLFAQIVWGATQRIGFGRAMAADGKCFTVCHYAPRGNISGQFKANVLPPKDGKKDLLVRQGNFRQSYVIYYKQNKKSACSNIE